MTISTLQLGVGCVYAIFMWLAPDARATPTVTLDDIKKMIPVGFCAAGAHSSSVFALSAGAVSFGQIVKAAEPAFAALVGLLIYGKQVRCGTNGRAGVCRIRTAAPAPAGVYARTRLLADKGGSECCEWRRDVTRRGLAWCGADLAWRGFAWRVSAPLSSRQP